MTETDLRGEVMRPSALGAGETVAWRQMLAGSRSLQRAFFSPTFALACERAIGRTYVVVLHDGGSIRGFLPFQFKSAWHERLRLAERIGGDLSDASGVIAWPDLRINSTLLMRLAGLASLFINHLMEDQGQFGLEATWSRVGYVTDIHTGPSAYFAAMNEHNRPFVRDTERRLRRAERTYGKLRYARLEQIPHGMIADLIRQKRLQYSRTHVPDPFARREYLRLIDVLDETPVPDCRLILTRLGAGDCVLAQHLGLQHHDVLSYWFPVYDPEARDVSPGRLLLWYTIQQATEGGIGLIDRGEGDAQYKRELATAKTLYGHANWSDGGVRSLPARAWQSLEWRLQRSRARSTDLIGSPSDLARNNSI
jgi:CelD/BcsL family acetyltransferase involved in cellulose biosynthesis